MTIKLKKQVIEILTVLKEKKTEKLASKLKKALSTIGPLISVNPIEMNIS
ncbi:unnamed protein product, partial [marine sediment metagenome]